MTYRNESSNAPDEGIRKALIRLSRAEKVGLMQLAELSAEIYNVYNVYFKVKLSVFKLHD